MSIVYELGQYLCAKLQTHNSKNSKDSIGVGFEPLIPSGYASAQQWEI